MMEVSSSSSMYNIVVGKFIVCISWKYNLIGSVQCMNNDDKYIQV